MLLNEVMIAQEEEREKIQDTSDKLQVTRVIERQSVRSEEKPSGAWRDE